MQTLAALDTLFFANGHARSEHGPAVPYSPTWIEAFIELHNADAPSARKLRRKAARDAQTGRQRIRVSVHDHRLTYADQTQFGEVDSTDAFGWRAALAAVRALRADHAHSTRYAVTVSDARIIDCVHAHLENS